MKNRTRVSRTDERFIPLDVRERGGPRPSVGAVLDLVDTTDPTWPSVAAVLREFSAAGIDLDATSVPMAVKLGKMRWAEEEEPAPAEFAQVTATAAATTSIVYYIRRGDLIKIGTTGRPAIRFAELLPDEILAAEPGGTREEARRHRQFAHLRGGGEHFHDAPELRDHIERMLLLHGEPDPAWPTSANARAKRPALPWRLPMPTSTETITAADAETELGIKENTLRAWVHRGRIQAAGCDERRRHLFYREHLIVLRDSARTRASAHL